MYGVYFYKLCSLDIQDFKDSEDGDRAPWNTMSVDDFLTHLMYTCDPCMGDRVLSDTCSGIRENTCTGETCEICPATNAHDGCENNCDFEWKSTSTVAPTKTQSTEAPTTKAPTTKAPTTKDTTKGLYIIILTTVYSNNYIDKKVLAKPMYKYP